MCVASVVGWQAPGYRAAAETFQIDAFYIAAQCKAPAFANKFFALRDYFGANAII
jgi:hypothetical protein